MWTIAKDHFRRKWLFFSFSSIVFTVSLCATLPWATLAEAPGNSQGNHGPDSGLCIYLAVVASGAAMHKDSSFVRVLRTLPFRESHLADLAWGMAVLAPTMFSFLLILLWELAALCVGKATLQSIVWASLFLVTLTLLMGTLSFMSTSFPFTRVSFKASQGAGHGQLSAVLSALQDSLGVPAGGVVAYLVSFPAPNRWANIGPWNLAGMCLAATLTWKSYQLRYRLLEPRGLRRTHAWKSPARESYPRYRETMWGALAQELKVAERATFLAVLGGIGFSYLLLFSLKVTLATPMTMRVYGDADHAIAFLTVLMAVLAVFAQPEGPLRFTTIRTLPLSPNRCVWLILSYPLAVSLALLPCVTVFLWLLGYGRLPALFLCGLVAVGGLCPFGMFLLARYGREGFSWVVGLPLASGALLMVMGSAMSDHFSVPWAFFVHAVLWASPFLGPVGYYGLRNVIEKDDDFYKREKSLPQFCQRLVR